MLLAVMSFIKLLQYQCKFEIENKAGNDEEYYDKRG